MRYRIAVLLSVAALPSLAGDWNPRKAADYLDSRAKEWIAWPTANSGAKPCISCHTAMPYLMARPILRTALGEKEPTEYETVLLQSLNSRLDKKTPDGQSLGTESIMASFFLRTPAAFDRMFSLQIREGKAAGGFKWFNTDLDPWEEPESDLFGASLAAMAIGGAPAEYRKQPQVQERVAALSAFLRGPHDPRPLHNGLAVAWASTKLPEAMDANDRQAIVREALDKQRPDGGWSIESLGPFKQHPNAPPAAPGSNAYATAFTTMVLLECGAGISQPKMERALEWLRSHQDREGGYWHADSLNKQYRPESMEIRFMRDAATGYAARALLEAGERSAK